MTWHPQESIAIYIHWPFCAKKCPYCDFAVTVRQVIDEPAVVDALAAELARNAAFYKDHVPKAHSIFFGGGTPSLMSPHSVERLIQKVTRLFGLTTDCEITLEANPTDAEALKFQGFCDAGVNRLSLGVQSLDDRELMVLGRNHDAGQARRALDATAQIFSNFSVDLMYALPNQDVSNWPDTVAELLSWQPAHVSLYQLTIEAGTAFDKAVARGILKPFDDDPAADLYLATSDVLTSAGLPAYEVSNHAKSGFESRHNLGYWRYQDYVGVGPGAHGRLTQGGQKHRTQNPRLLGEWQSQTTVQPIALSELDADEEALLMSMRTREGAIVGEKLQINHERLEMLVDQEMLERYGNSIRPTREGWLRLDTITGMLLA